LSKSAAQTQATGGDRPSGISPAGQSLVVSSSDNWTLEEGGSSSARPGEWLAGSGSIAGRCRDTQRALKKVTMTLTCCTVTVTRARLNNAAQGIDACSGTRSTAGRAGEVRSSGRDDDGGGGGGQGLEDGQRYQPAPPRHCHLQRDGDWQVKPLRDTEYCTKIWKHMRSQSPSSLALRGCASARRSLVSKTAAATATPRPPHLLPRPRFGPWTEKPFV
jgi:hypothetical protein